MEGMGIAACSHGPLTHAGERVTVLIAYFHLIPLPTITGGQGYGIEGMRGPPPHGSMIDPASGPWLHRFSLQPIPFGGIYSVEMNLIATLFNFGGPDLILILLVVLVIFGPKKLPELARGLRQAMNEFNKAKDDVERELTRTDVTVQPAPGQQPRQPAELPLAPPPVGLSPTAQVAPPVEDPHPAARA